MQKFSPIWDIKKTSSNQFNTKSVCSFWNMFCVLCHMLSMCWLFLFFCGDSTECFDFLTTVLQSCSSRSKATIECLFGTQKKMLPKQGYWLTHWVCYCILIKMDEKSEQKKEKKIRDKMFLHFITYKPQKFHW